MSIFCLCPLATILQYFTDTGVVLAGGKVNTYRAGTSTPTPTWTDITANVQNANPITLNAAGRLPNVSIWQQAGVPIKVTITDSVGNAIGPTFDNISGIGDPGTTLTTFYGGTDFGTTNAYVLSFIASFTSYTSGLVVYWIPSNSNTGASTININGLGVVNLTNQDGTALSANQLITGQVAIIASQGGNFVLLFSGIAASIVNGSFAPSWTGFAGSPPAGTMFYQIVNSKQVTLQWIGSTGTSTTTGLTIGNLPTAIRPATNGSTFNQQVTVVMDNGAGSVGSFGFGALGVMQFNKGAAPSATGFTAAGAKGLESGWTGVYGLR